jgi:hypothetical protein
MNRRLLNVATFGTVLFSVFFLARASWLKAAPAAEMETVAAGEEHDPFNTASAMRFRRCQENHWRACVMQR